MVDEQVALYGPDGGVVGAAPRSRVRAQNLHHGATAVLVRDGRGRVYVHRRSAGKDVYPGLLDFCAGGVIQAGEDPLGSAVREVAEELGVTGAELVLVGEDVYADECTSYRAFLYRVTYDGPIRWQPEEVVAGEWVALDDLRGRLRERPEEFVPDSTALWRSRLADGGGSGWAVGSAPLP